MAQRRMVSPQIVETDAFLDMPVTSQALYFHLLIRADDDGFVTPKMIMRMIGASHDDLKVLITKRFVLSFDSGVVVIKHWLIHNLIRADMYRETSYLKEKSSLGLNEYGAYTELREGVSEIKKIEPPNWLKKRRGGACTDDGTQTVHKRYIGKDRLGKDRLGKDRTEQQRYGEDQNVRLSDEEYNRLVTDLGEQPTLVLIEELDQYISQKGKDPYKSHKATIKAWFRRRMQEHANKNSKGPNVVEI